MMHIPSNKKFYSFGSLKFSKENYVLLQSYLLKYFKLSCGLHTQFFILPQSALFFRSLVESHLYHFMLYKLDSLGDSYIVSSNLSLASSLNRTELNILKSSLFLTDLQKEVMFGCLLGDLHLNKIGLHCRLLFEQKNKDYLFHLYNLYENFVRAIPKERLQKRLKNSPIRST